jgi:hypothetical protein
VNQIEVACSFLLLGLLRGRLPAQATGTGAGYSEWLLVREVSSLRLIQGLAIFLASRREISRLLQPRA